MSSLLALDLAKNFVSPAMWILGETSSIVSTVAATATYPWTLAALFFTAASMAVPYIVMQLVLPGCHLRTRFTQWACKGMSLGGVIWFFMAYLSRNLDYDVATSVFLLNGVFSISMAGILGYGINLEQIQKADKK